MLMTNCVDQDDFSIYPKKALAGAIVEAMLYSTQASYVETGTFEFGDAMIKGSKSGLVIPFDGSSTFFNGVFFRRFSREGRVFGSHQPNPSPETEILGLMVGCVWVVAKNAISGGDVAAINAGGEWVGAGGVSGDWTLQGATFLTDAKAGELVKLELTGGRHFAPIS